MTDAFRKNTDLLLLLNKLVQRGAGDSSEADDVRETMMKWWYEMTDSEQQFLIRNAKNNALKHMPRDVDRRDRRFASFLVSQQPKAIS